MSRGVLVLGAGGHAKVVIAALQAAGAAVEAAFSNRADQIGGSLLGVPVLADTRLADWDDTAEAIVAIGDNASRRAVADSRDFAWCSVLHPRAWVHASVAVGVGSVVMAGAMVQPDVRLGPHSIVNTGATVDHDCSLGAYAHVAPGARLAGSVVVGPGVLIGAGAVLIPGVEVGADAVVGAGSVVIRDVAAGSRVAGNPARPL